MSTKSLMMLLEILDLGKLYLGTVEEVACEAWDCLVSEQFLNSYDLRF